MMILTTRLIMKKLKQITIFGIFAIIASVMLITSIPSAAAESDENSVNDISIKTMFLFNHGEEEINTFKVFRQLNGYNENTPPKFELQGIVDGKHPLLYEEAHKQHHYQAAVVDKRDFDVMVSLTCGIGVIPLHTF